GLQGLGAGGLLPVAIAVVADLYALRERARIQALFSAIWGTASLIGPLLGAFLTLSFGWRSIFLVIVPLGLVSLVLEATQMRESRASRPEPFDWLGGATLTVGVTALLLATLHEPGARGHLQLRLLMFAVGAALLAAFARLQVGREHPLVPLTLLTHRETAAPYVAGALAEAPVAWISAACALIGMGLGPLATSQMLAVQHAAPETQRGVASSLVPFFRALGGALGVGTLGGLLSAGLDRRLGAAADV